MLSRSMSYSPDKNETQLWTKLYENYLRNENLVYHISINICMSWEGKGWLFALLCGHEKNKKNEKEEKKEEKKERSVKWPVGGPTSRMPRSVAKIHLFKGECYVSRGMERGKNSFEARHKEKPTSMLERLDRWGREGPMGSRLQNIHQEIGG